jgi:hypothetical protein
MAVVFLAVVRATVRMTIVEPALPIVTSVVVYSVMGQLSCQSQKTRRKKTASVAMVLIPQSARALVMVLMIIVAQVPRSAPSVEDTSAMLRRSQTQYRPNRKRNEKQDQHRQNKKQS